MEHKKKVVREIKSHSAIQRAMVGILVVALLLGQIETLNVFASANTEMPVEKTKMVISAFSELPETVREQIVPVGTALDDLVLPNTLEAVTLVEQEKSEEAGSPTPMGSPTATLAPTATTSPSATEDPEGEASAIPTASPSADEDAEDEAGAEGAAPTASPLAGEDLEGEAGSTLAESSSAAENQEEAAGSDAAEKPEEATDTEADASQQEAEDQESESQEAAMQAGDLGDLQAETITETMKEVYSSLYEDLTIGTLMQGTLESASEVQTDDVTDTAETEIITETITIEGVSWASTPEYDGETAGEYIFTAVLPEGYGLAEGVSLPQIMVLVTEAQDGGEIELLTRPYDEENSSDMVYYLEGSYESYSWEIWTGEEWQEISEYGPELVVGKEEWYTYQFRCIVKKDGIRFTARAKDDWQIENSGIMLMAADDGDSDQSDYMYYSNGTGLYYNIKGIDKGSLIKTTFMDRGYRTASSVNGGSKVDWNGAGEVAMGNSLYGTREISLVHKGRYAKIEYIVENRGSVTQSFQVGSSADVMIADNDRAPVVGSASGLSMTGSPKNSYEFNLVAPTVSTLWYGFYRYAYDEMFNNLEDRSEAYTGDSGMAWSWSGTVEPGQTWSGYVLLGVGELPPSPKMPTLNNQDPVLQPGKAIKFTGTAEPGNEVCIEVGGEEFSGTADDSGNFSVTVIPPENLQEGETNVNYYAVSPEGGISEVGSIKAVVGAKTSIFLTDTSVSIIEDSVLDDEWYRSLIKSSDGTVSYDASMVKTGTPGTYEVTYTAAKTGCEDAVATLTVIVLPLPLELSDVTATRVSGKDSFTLVATLKYTGGETISETGFVWGIMQNPTVSLNNGSKTTTPAIKNKGASINVTAEGIADSVTYYARAYAKTSGGNVYYSPQKAFSINGKSYGTFTIKNNNNNTFTVTRTGGIDGTQTVYFRTVNGSAVGGTHFTHQASTLIFAQGETSKTITITEKSVTTTYSSKAATAYSNADRTYQVEIYRVEGGGALGTTTSATRTMAKNSSYVVDRSIYDWQTINGPQLGTKRGDYDDDKLGWTNGASYDETAKETISIQNELLKDTREYWTNTADSLYYYLTFDAKEVEDGYQVIQITPGSNLDTNVYPYTGSLNGSLLTAYYVAQFEHGGSGKNTNYASYTFPRSSGNRNTLTNTSRIVNNSYVCFDITQTEMSVGYGASGSNSDEWYTQSVVHHFQLKDTKEPQLLGVAPMAGGTYKEGDKVTISLIFDEIVDSTNSTLSSVLVNTSWGSFTYAGGADTNVLYFKGTVPSDATGTLTVNSITGSQYIKDMCSTAGTAPSGSGSTTVSVDNKTPTVSITNTSITNQTAKATITATNTDTLKYTWNQSSTMPVTGWLTSTSGQEVSTRQTSGIWYLHVLGTYNATGSTDYQYTSFNFASGSSGAMPELTLSADNSAWARSRIITLAKTPSDASVTVKTPAGVTSAVTGTTYTAEANGSYTFTLLTSDGETVVKSIAVSKIDRTVPEVTITGPVSLIQNENVKLNVMPGDAGGSGVKTVTGTWTVKTNGGSVTTQTAVLELNGDGTYLATTPGSTGNSYTYKLNVTVTDNAGNTASISSDTYTVNLKVPTISVNQISSDSRTGDTYSYTVIANGNTITAVQLPGGTITTDLSGTFTLTTSGTYYVIVSDAAGHVVRSDAMTVAAGVDGDAPEVRLYQENEDWTNKPVKIDVSIYEEGTIVSAVWKKEGGESAAEIEYEEEETHVYSGGFCVTENATYTVIVTDANGNEGTDSITVSNIDLEEPEVTCAVNTDPDAESGWYSADNRSEITLTYSDNVGVSGISVKVDDGSFTPINGTDTGSAIQSQITAYYTSLLEGEHTYTFKAVDAAGNETITDPVTIKLDTNKPEPGEASFNEGYKNLWNWNIRKESLIITIPVSEAGSGLDAVTYILKPADGQEGSAGGSTEKAEVTQNSGADSSSDYVATICINQDFKGSITIIAKDNAGNASDTKTIGVDGNGIHGVIVEDNAPKISFTVNGGAVSENYYDTAPNILVSVTDDEDEQSNGVITGGIASVTYQIGSSGTQKSDGNDYSESMVENSTFTISANEIPTGETEIIVTATDNAGNVASKSIIVKVKGPEATPDAAISYIDETLTGLVANAEYKINNSVNTADENGVILIESSWIGTTISIERKGNGSTTLDSAAQSLSIPARPNAPTPGLGSRTDTRVTLQTIVNAQYRMENGTWQSDTTFSGLTPKTKYTFEAYYPATSSSFSSPTGSVVIATSLAAPDENSVDKLVMIDYEKETFIISDQVEAFRDAACTQAINPNETYDVTDYMGGTIYIRYPADGDFPESGVKSISIKERPANPTIGHRDETYPGAGDGVITGLTEGIAYEISSDGGSTWTDAVLSGTEIKGLTPGSYQVRGKAGEKNFQSEASNTVAIGTTPTTAETTPQAEISYGDGTLTGLTPGEKYEVSYTAEDGATRTQEYIADENGKLRFEDEWYGQTIEIVKSGNGKDKTDSDPQSIGLSTRPKAPEPNSDGESGSGKNNGSISNLTSGEIYEISADGGKTWKDVEADEDGQIKNLNPGNYEIRVKATDDTFPSESVKVRIPAYPSQSTGSGSGEGRDYDGNHDGDGSGSDNDSGQEFNGETGNNTGKILKEVENNENAPGTQISMTTDELAAVVLTDTERQSVEKGTDIKILLIVEDAADSTSSQDKTVIDNAKGGFEVGQYLDISLLKIIGGSSEKIVETNGMIRITIDVPDGLKNTSSTETREFAVIRVHNGEAVILNDLDTDEDTVTIETNRFSSYALLYRDVPNNGGVKNSESTKDNEPKTGDNTHLAPYATAAMIAGLAYLRMYFGDIDCGMTEEEKKELISKIIRWARRGGKLRRILALAAIIPILMYYHSIGKKTTVKWNKVYGA